MSIVDELGQKLSAEERAIARKLPDVLAPWTPWDYQGELRGEKVILGRTVYLSRRPEGLYLARFLNIATGSVHRFMAETLDVALQHAHDHIRDHLTDQERHALALADADSAARSELDRVNRELTERKRAAGILN